MNFSSFPLILVLLLLSPVLNAATGSGEANEFFSSQILDSFTFYPVQIEGIVNYDGTERRGSGGNHKDTQWGPGMRVKVEGDVLDPAIARFLMDGEYLYTIDTIDSNGIEEKREGDLLRYRVNLDLLQGTPGLFGYNFSAQRNSDLNTGTLGSRYENESENMSASINWKNQAFPMTFSYLEKSLKQEFLSGQGGGGVISQRDELLETWTLKGRSSKLSLDLEQQFMDDHLPSRDQDFDLTRAKLNHRLNWGRDSNLVSNFNYYDRSGFNPNEYLTIEERARIQHTDNVYSSSSYRFHSVMQDIETIDQSGNFGLTHQLYSNLTSTARLEGSSSSSDILDETRLGTWLESQYQKQNFFGATVNAGIALAEQETERDSSQGLITYTDESHIVPLSSRVIFNQRFIATSTVIVTNATGILVYAEGLDYNLTPVTGNLIELQTIPGGQINTGDLIKVTYQAEVLPSQAFSTTFSSFNLGVDYGWMRLTHSDRSSHDKLLSGADESFLNENRYAVTNLEFRWNMFDIETSLGAERHYNKINGFETITNTFQQYFNWEANREAVWSLSMVESFTETDTQETDLYSLELSLRWQPYASLLIRPTLGSWRRLDKVVSDPGVNREDAYINAGFSLRWNYRKVQMVARYQHSRRTTDDDETTEDSLMVNLVRRF